MAVYWFGDAETKELGLVGGKGWNLGEMYRAGFPVPKGFCVSAKAYERVLKMPGMWEQISEYLEKMKGADITAKQAYAEQIRSLWWEVEIPRDIAQAVSEAYEALGGERLVAVRSSATAEDLPEASFAGQQETFLGVRGQETLLAKVRSCWSSLWALRSMDYRERQGFPHENVRLSVVVQEMISPDVAGVLFTVNPLNGQPEQMLLNASYGLGETVVSGRVTPDTYTLHKGEPLRVIERVLGEKAERLDMLPESGTVATSVDAEARGRFSLSEGALQKLVQLGMRVEGHYSAPQDIEWGVVGEEVFLLQTRPITTLAQLPPPSEVIPTKKLSSLQYRILDDILEHFPEAPYPLDHASVVDTYQQFLDATRALGITMTQAKQMIRMDENGRPFVEIGRMGANLRLLGLPWIIWRKMRRDPSLWRTVEEEGVARRLQALREVKIDSLDDKGLVEHTKQANALASDVGKTRFADYIYPAILRSVWLKLLMRFAGQRGAESFDLLGDLSFKTAEIHHALSELAKTARRIPSVVAWFREATPPLHLEDVAKISESSEFVTAFDAFLKRYGARTNKVYLPFSNLSWGEQPSALLATLAVMVRSSDAEQDEEAQRIERYRQLVQRITAKLPWWLRGSFTRTLERFREGHIAREATLFAIEGAFVQARRGVHTLAQRFVERGLLQDTSDVRYLTLEEIEGAVNKKLESEAIQSMVASRKKARRTAQSLWQARPVLSRSSEKGVYKGIAGSPGQATGTVCVVTGVDAFFKLQEGDILVCPYTDPTWTPLFAMASAVVADTGGPLSHAAIVAREYQIPAVLGLPNATTTFQDGMRVSVDGTTGLVRIMADAANV